MFDMLADGDALNEICDECGFHGGTLDLPPTVARLRSLPDAVVRHALHDAEHHVLDARRGINRQHLRR